MTKKVDHELLARSVEKPGQQMGERSAASLSAIDDRGKREGTPLFFMTDVSLPLEDAKQREYGVVRRTRRTLDALDDVANGGVRKIPEHVHDAVLSVGQTGRRFSGHDTTICLTVSSVN